MRRAWSHDELMLAMNLYCQLPFGKLHARNREVIALASALNRTPSSVAMKLCNLASLDPVHQQRGIRGLSKVSAADRGIWDAFHSDWNGLAAESELLRDTIFASGQSKSSVDDLAIDSPLDTSAFVGESETVRPQKVRLAQRFFRKAVVSSYDYRCCITQIAVGSLLVASHIVPWARSPTLRANPRNGLCLSRLHDAAFDRGLVTIDEEHRLVLSTELRDATTNAVLEAAFAPFESKTINLPQKFRPESAFLAIHRETVFRG
jgi:predicted restriction endonuclease